MYDDSYQVGTGYWAAAIRQAYDLLVIHAKRGSVVGDRLVAYKSKGYVWRYDMYMLSLDGRIPKRLKA